LDNQKRLVREWIDWNFAVGAQSNLPDYLEAYGVNLDFKSDLEARQFMNSIYEELIVEIRRREPGWKA